MLASPWAWLAALRPWRQDQGGLLGGRMCYGMRLPWQGQWVVNCGMVGRQEAAFHAVSGSVPLRPNCSPAPLTLLISRPSSGTVCVRHSLWT